MVFFFVVVVVVFDSRFIYPGLVSLFIATVYFPLGLGQFLASTLTTQQQINSLFSNFTWLKDDLTVSKRRPLLSVNTSQGQCQG